MILHSACHLFSEGKLDKGLRDLTDIQILLEQYHSEHGVGSANKLLRRAEQLNLDHQLMLATRYVAALLLNTVDLTQYNQHHCPSRPFATIRSRLLDWCYLRLIIPHHHISKRPSTAIATILILVRSHYLKMPLRLLIPHLTIKCWYGLKANFKAAD